MNSNQFEKLLDQYSLGQIDILSYRKKRSELIQNILKSATTNSEEYPSGFNNIPNYGSQNQILTSDETKSNFVVPTIDTKKRPLDSTNYLVFLSIAIIAIAGVFVYYFSAEIKSTFFTQNSSEEVTLENQEQQEIDESFIIEFINENDWSTQAQSDFLVKWQSLSRTEQSNVRQKDNFRQLSDILRQKINNLESLTTTHTTDSREQDLLIWFASKLSIRIN